MDAFPTSLRPLAGGHSGETFLADVAGEEAVVRVYGGRSAVRGPLAPEIDAAVLDLVRGVLPVPEVLEVRRGDPDADLPGLLVTSRLPGERLDLLLPNLRAERLAQVGANLGVLAGRLGHMVQTHQGMFTDRSLVPDGLPEHLRDLPTWVEMRTPWLGDTLVARLRRLAAGAQDLLDEERRACVVHSDLNPKNLLVDPGTLEVSGVLDWEFAHAGSPYTDLGNLLRLHREPALVDSVVTAYRAFMPSTPEDLLDRVRAADLFALTDLAARTETNDAVASARALVEAIAESDDLHATPAKS